MCVAAGNLTHRVSKYDMLELVSRHPRCWTSTLLCLFFIFIRWWTAWPVCTTFRTSLAVSHVATCLRHGPSGTVRLQGRRDLGWRLGRTQLEVVSSDSGREREQTSSLGRRCFCICKHMYKVIHPVLVITRSTHAYQKTPVWWKCRTVAHPARDRIHRSV